MPCVTAPRHVSLSDQEKEPNFARPRECFSRFQNIQNGQSVPVGWSSRDFGLSFVMSLLNLPAAVEGQHTETSFPALSFITKPHCSSQKGRTDGETLSPARKEIPKSILSLPSPSPARNCNQIYTELRYLIVSAPFVSLI